MPFDAFGEFGAFEFTSEHPRGRNIYQAMLAAKQDAFDTTLGTYAEAKIYAQAMGIARARYALQRAFNQREPFKCIELLPQLERDWGCVPGPNDTILDRQAAVAAQMILVRGSRREAVEEGLRNILGANFIALRTPDFDETIFDQGVSNYVRPDLPYKVVRTTTPIAPIPVIPTPQEVDYLDLDGGTGYVKIEVGDLILMDPETDGLTEIIQVVSSSSTTFKAAFKKSHDVGTFCTTQNWVEWFSTQRTMFVVVKDPSSLDRELRRRVHEFMGKTCYTGTLWEIVKPTSSGATTIGPFTLDGSTLGDVTVGQIPIISYPPADAGMLTQKTALAAGGETILLYGRNFSTVTDVQVAGVSVSFTIIDDYTISFVTAAHAAMLVSLSIVSTNGTVVMKDSLTFV